LGVDAQEATRPP